MTLGDFACPRSKNVAVVVVAFWWIGYCWIWFRCRPRPHCCPKNPSRTEKKSWNEHPRDNCQNIHPIHPRRANVVLAAAVSVGATVPAGPATTTRMHPVLVVVAVVAWNYARFGLCSSLPATASLVHWPRLPKARIGITCCCSPGCSSWRVAAAAAAKQFVRIQIAPRHLDP